MKICQVTSAHATFDTRIFHKQCISLAKNGFEVYLVAHGDSIKKDGVNIVGLGEKPTSRIKRMMFAAKKAYKKALEIDADIYHLHDPELLPYGEKLKKAGKIVIFDSHEDYTESIAEKKYLNKNIAKIVAKRFNKYFDKSLKKMNAVISVTPHLHEKLLKINKNTVMVTNYPKIKEDNSIEKIDKTRAIAFAGGINLQWNHEKIIDAIEQIDDVSYNLCGIQNQAYLENLKLKKGWEKVNFLGKIPFEEVKQVYSNSFIGVSLLDYVKNAGGKMGTLGNTKIFEMMEAGLPIICTDFELWKTMIIDKYNCGIAVDPNNVEEIAKAIKYLLDNPEEAKKMGQNGRKAVLEEFNWKTQEKILVDLYKDLLKGV